MKMTRVSSRVRGVWQRRVLAVALALVSVALIGRSIATAQVTVAAETTTTLVPTTTIVGPATTTTRPATTTSRPPSTTGTRIPSTTTTTGVPEFEDHFQLVIGQPAAVVTMAAGHRGLVRVTMADGSDPSAGVGLIANWSAQGDLSGFVRGPHVPSCTQDTLDGFYGPDQASGTQRFTAAGGPLTLTIENFQGASGTLELGLRLAPPDVTSTLAAGQAATLSTSPGQRRVVHLTNPDGSEIAADAKVFVTYTLHGYGSLGDYEAVTQSGEWCLRGLGGGVTPDWLEVIESVSTGGPFTFTFRSPLDSAGAVDVRFVLPTDVRATVSEAQPASVQTGLGQNAIVRVTNADGSDPAPDSRFVLRWTAHGYGDENTGSVHTLATDGYADVYLGSFDPNDVASTATVTAPGGPLQILFDPYAVNTGSIAVTVAPAPPPPTSIPSPTTTGTTMPGGGTTTLPSTTTTRFPTTTRPISSTTAGPSTTTTRPATTTTRRATTTTRPTTTRPTTTTVDVPWYITYIRILLCFFFHICP